MPEPKHAVDKARPCEIAGCSAIAERSVKAKNVKKTDMKPSADDLKSVHMCKVHYREFKKKSKKDRTYDRLGW